MPMLSLVTDLLPQLGHLWRPLTWDVIRVHCFLTVMPPRVLNRRPKVFFFLGINRSP
jgi:hypothetical protein